MSTIATVKCPNCQHEFPIGDALAKEIEGSIRKRYLDRFTKDQKDLEDEKRKLAEESEALKKRQEDQQRLIDEKVKQQKQVLEHEAMKKASEEVNARVLMMQKELEEKSGKLKDAQQKELEMMQKEKSLHEREEALKLELEKQMLERQKQIEDNVRKIEHERNELRFREYEKKLSDQMELIETMKRKAEQGSMQLQGEVQELALEEMLRSAFPYDTVEEVGKGVKGADAIQTVRNQFGHVCGKIIYESKRTKAFANEWIEKLKADMRAQQADIAIIVTEAFPKDMDRFGMKDGVWICSYFEIKSLAYVLRDGLVKLYAATASQENKGDKMQMLYDYLTGNEFHQQVEAIVEGFMSLRDGLTRERIQMEKIWKEREKQLDKVLLNTTHFFGSVKGIAGNAIGDIKLLDMGE